MIHVIATIKLLEGQRQAWLAEFQKVLPKVKAEVGCIEYAAAFDVATGLPVQPPIRDDVAIVIEKWSDLDALKAHLASPHMAEYRERVKDMLNGITLHVHQPA